MISEILNTYQILFITIFVYMTIWFLISVLKKRNDVADVAWGIGFLLATLVSFLLSEVFSWRSIIVLNLITIWALRLSLHIYFRNRGKTEDYRYKNWREQWGKWFYLRTYFQVFILQGILLLLIVSPAIFATTYFGTSINILDFFGTAVWVMGFIFESVGDLQLIKFIKDKNNKGKLLQTGLWKYTRHPNYFGEVAQWWGISIIALSVPYGFLGFIGAFTITFLILKVSGIPLLEEKMKQHPDFAEYSRKTNVFFPGFPQN